jgi:dihydrofolate reductase
MRVSVFVGVTIDGYLAGKGGTLDHLKPFENVEHGYQEFFRSIDAIVVGRATWETASGFPQWPWENKRVVVLTHRALPARHGESAHEGALAPLFERLAADGIGRVYLDGGLAIRQGLDEDLIDDLTITTVPHTLGEGIPLFGGVTRPRTWTTESVRMFANGMMQARYLRTR